MEWIMEHWDDLLTAATYIVTGASILAKMTPTEVDDNFVGKTIKLLDKIAINNNPTVKK